MRPETIDLVDPDTFAFGPPHDVFARLRATAPAFLHHRAGLPPFWVVSRHRDAVAVSRDWALFSSQRNGVSLDEPAEGNRRAPDQTLVNLDPPEHTRLRGLIGKCFTPQAVADRSR